MTDQGQQIDAITIDDFLISLDTHLVEPCANGTQWTLHWTPTEPSFTQTGDDIIGHMGPKPITSYTGEPVLIETQVRARIGTHPHGTLLGTAIRSPGPSSVGCTSGPVTFTLQRNS